eukprot:COSAG06_NODE_2620_length_6567_cov_17.636827_3_plen_249_part_00
MLSEDGKKFEKLQTFNLGECEHEGSLGVNMDEIFFYDDKINGIIHFLLSHEGCPSLALTLEKFEELAADKKLITEELAAANQLITDLQAQLATRLAAAGGGGAVLDEPDWMAGKSYNEIKDKSLDHITIPFSNPKNKGLLKNSEGQTVLRLSKVSTDSNFSIIDAKKLMIKAAEVISFMTENETLHAGILATLRGELAIASKSELKAMLPADVKLPGLTGPELVKVTQYWLFPLRVQAAQAAAAAAEE